MGGPQRSPMSTLPIKLRACGRLPGVPVLTREDIVSTLPHPYQVPRQVHSNQGSGEDSPSPKRQMTPGVRDGLGMGNSA